MLSADYKDHGYLRAIELVKKHLPSYLGEWVTEVLMVRHTLPALAEHQKKLAQAILDQFGTEELPEHNSAGSMCIVHKADRGNSAEISIRDGGIGLGLRHSYGSRVHVVLDGMERIVAACPYRQYADVVAEGLSRLTDDQLRELGNP